MESTFRVFQIFENLYEPGWVGRFCGSAASQEVTLMQNKIAFLQDLLARGFFNNEYRPVSRTLASSRMDHWVSSTFLTPFQTACFYVRIEHIRMLPEHDPDVNSPAHDNVGLTALQAAVESGHVGLVLRLLQLGADINSPAAKYLGKAALEQSAWRGYLDIAHLLVINSPDMRMLRKIVKGRRD